MEPITLEAGAVVNFVADNGAARTLEISGPGAYIVEAHDRDDLEDEISCASAVALEVAADLQLIDKGVSSRKAVEDDLVGGLSWEPGMPADKRTGVVLCCCGGSSSSIIDLSRVAVELQDMPGVTSVREMSQICTELAAREIKALVSEEKLNRLVVAACRCCNLEQICFSCTEQRVRCQQFLNEQLAGDLKIPVEFVNIREQCAWVHSLDTVKATRKAVDIISSGVLRVQGALSAILLKRPISSGVLILSTGLSSLAAAASLATYYPVTLVYKSGLKKTGKKQPLKYFEAEAALLKEMGKSGVSVVPWPKKMNITGVPGSYQIELEPADVSLGAVIADAGAVDKILAGAETSFKDSLVGRIFMWHKNTEDRGMLDFALRESAIGDPTGIYVVSSNTSASPEGQVMLGRAIAARVLSYLSRGVLRAQITAVNIDKQLCRGCGDCMQACPYIEMKISESGIAYATVDPVLCLGCGACITLCPTGAISQPVQSDLSIINTLAALLARSGKVGAAS
jgi:heterodisulfide reductase subunit A